MVEWSSAPGDDAALEAEVLALLGCGGRGSRLELSPGEAEFLSRRAQEALDDIVATDPSRWQRWCPPAAYALALLGGGLLAVVTDAADLLPMVFG